jgi:hypothetical protein
VNNIERLLDKEIHLISTYQLIGFRYIVETLWEVSDEYYISIVRILYETIKDKEMIDSMVYKGAPPSS